MTYLIYPSMTRTLAFIKERGYTMQPVSMAKNVERITVRYWGSLSDFYKEVPDENAAYYETVLINSAPAYVTGSSSSFAYDTVSVEQYYDYYETLVEITDKAEIEACLQSLTPTNYCHEFGPFPETQEQLDVTISFQIKDETQPGDVVYWEEQFCFTGEIPDFIMERIIEKITK